MSTDPAPGANPFPGLRPFRTEEHHLFFGREEQTAALLGLLREHRFLAIVGTSGSGKSSLVRAGLIPSLHRGSMARAGTSWEVVVLRPGGHPIASLARGLVEADLYDPTDPETTPRLHATLARSIFGLVEAVRQSRLMEPGTNLLVVVDQFEELFRFREQGVDSEEAAAAFVNLLLSAAQAQDARIYIAITMRSDYLGDCAQIPGLAEAVNRGEYLIPRLTRDQRRDAIEKPVGVGGARIAPRLVQLMLNDVGDDPDQLPVLQHALLRTWEAWTADHAVGEPLDLRHYESTGGMAEALSRHADEVFASLPDEQHRATAQRIFKALTIKGPDNRGIRRPGRLARLTSIVGASEATVSRVVDAYRQPGVTFLMPGARTELAPEVVVDLSHESLMRVWRRLTAWVEEEAQSARIYRRLADTAALWHKGEAGLYHDPDLQIAWSWREVSAPNASWAAQYGGGFELAVSFLEASRESASRLESAREVARQRELEQAKALAEAQEARLLAQRRAARRLRVFAVGLAVALGLALVAFFFAIDARKEALKNANLAMEKEAAASRAAGLADQAATRAEASSKELEQTLVRSDFEQGVKHLEAGESAEGLPHLARALRTDPGFAPAALRAMSTLSSGLFPLQAFPLIEQRRVITTERWNEKEDLLFTSDTASDVKAPERLVWDARTGAQLYSLGEGAKMSADTAWSEDGAILVSYLEEARSIQAWEARTGKMLDPIVAPEVTAMRLAQHPEAGTLILAHFSDWTLRVFRASRPGVPGRPATPLLEPPAPTPESFGFTPDGRRVYAECSNLSIAIWDALTGERADTISTRPHPTSAGGTSGGRGGLYFTPDGTTLLARAGDGKHVAWWQIGAPHADAPWIELPDLVDLRLLPGAKKVALISSAAPGGLLHVVVHDLATREETARLDTPRPMVLFLPQSQERFRDLEFPLLGAFEANTFRVWDLETGGLIRETFTPALLRYAAFSPEGRRVLTLSTTDDLMLWDLFTGQPLLSEALKLRRGFARFSPDGERLLAHDGERRLLLVLDSRTGQPLREPLEQPFVAQIYFSGDGERALISERQTTRYGGGSEKLTTSRFRIVELGLRPELAEPLLGRTGQWVSTAVTPDGGTIIALGARSAQGPVELSLLDAAERRLLRSAPLPPGIYTYGAPAVTSDGRKVALGCSDARARLFDVAKGDFVAELAHERAVMALCFSADGKRLATGTDQGKVRIWDIEAAAPLTEPMALGDQRVDEVAFSPDGTLLAIATRDFKLHVLEWATGKARFEPLELNNVLERAPRFSLDGAFLVAAPFDPDALIVNMEGGSIVRRLHHSDSCRGAHLSPDGSILAVGTGGDYDSPVGEVRLWSWRDGRMLGPPLDTRGAAGPMDFSSDGRLLATGTILPTGGAVQVWDIGSGLPVTDRLVGRSAVYSVSFRPGAAEVVAAWRDGTVRILDLPSPVGLAPGTLARLAEAVAHKRLPAKAGAVEDVPHEELEALRREASAGWLKWFFSASDDRTISPNSKMTLREYLARLRKSSVLEDLQDAVRLSPRDGLSCARVGLALLDGLASEGALDRQPEVDARLRRHWESTAAWYAGRAVELEPANAAVWALRAEVLNRLGRKSDAAQALARALELDPSRGSRSSPNARYLQALLQAKEGQWAEADAEFAAALDGLAAEAAKSDGAPLLGVLVDLVPGRAPAGYRDLELPAPIPGTHEDFDSAPEGKLPPGWMAEHERPDAPPLRSAAGRLDGSASDIFADWTCIAVERVAAGLEDREAQPFFPGRLLARGERERVNGSSPSWLLQGRFLYAVSGGRGASGVQRLTTPEYDCSGRAGVHVVFHSASEQAGETLTALEYTIDGGASWLPVRYWLNSEHLVLDAAGRPDAQATMTKPRPWSPLYRDEAGRLLGGRYGDLIGAPVSRALDPFVQGRRRDIRAEGKRVEIFRLEKADGQARVQLRFLQAGRYGWYWGIDDLGLYELPQGGVSQPESIDRTRDAGFLGDRAYRIAFGDGASSGSARLGEELLRDAVAAEGDAGQAAAASSADEGVRRRRLDALLIARRALTLTPDDPRILGAAASIAAFAGELDLARGWLQRLWASGPLDSALALESLAVYRRWADALEASGDRGGATVLYEAAYLLEKASLGRVDRGLMAALSKTELLGESQLLLPRGSTWAYLDDGTEPGPGWREPEFDDETWLRGPARLGYGGDGERTVVRFGSNPREKFITTYFRASFEVDDPGRFPQLKLSVQRDDGVVVSINGLEVARDNMPQGKIGPTTLAPETVSGDSETRFSVFDLTSALRPGKNVVAAEVHQAVADSSDLGFDLELEAFGGLKETSRDLREIEEIEARLELPAALRSALWVSRAESARMAGHLEGAESALERAARLGPGNPAVDHQRALQQAARGEAEAAAGSYREAVEAAIALKSVPRSSFPILLPASLRTFVEPVVEPAGLALAAAAHRMAIDRAMRRETECDWLLGFSELLDREGHAARLERAEARLALGREEAALREVDLDLADGPLPAGAPPARYRERIESLDLRERCLRQLERTAEADRARDEILAFPQRDPKLGPEQLDLSAHYTASLYDGRKWHATAQLRTLAEDLERGAIGFDVRGIVQLNSGAYSQQDSEAALRGKDINQRYGTSYPEEVAGIHVGLSARALHFLVASIHGRAPEVGSRIATIVIHYEDGGQVELPLEHGVDLEDWADVGATKVGPDRVAWVGGRPLRVLFLKTWTNPSPERRIASFDFVSARVDSAPFLVAATAQ